MAGVDSNGFTLKTYEEILDEVNAEQKQDLGAEWDVSETSPEGVMNASICAQLAEMWEVLAAVYNAFDPDVAEGVQQDRLAALTGSVREEAKSSTVDVVCVGTNATLLSAGRVISLTGGTSRFESTADRTIVTLSAWAGSTAFVVGDLRTNDGGKIYSCTVAGTSAGAGGPTGTGAVITDGSCTWRYVGTGTAAVSVPFQSEEAAAIVANAGALTTIETSVGGWSSCVNPLDAVVGQPEESDAAFRPRRYDELRVQGASVAEAIRADILDLEGVTACVVFQNESDVTNGDGLPPHSVEAVVLGGDDQAIVDALGLLGKAAGIQTYGSSSGTATDSSGNVHTVYFTRPTAKPVYITVDVTVLSTSYPSDGDTQIKTALVAHGSALAIGDDVVRSQLNAPIDGVDGTYDITDIKLGFTVSPVGTSNLPIGSRELATFDTSRIVVNTTVL